MTRAVSIVLQSRPEGPFRPDNLRIQEYSLPEVGGHQVLVRVRYVALAPMQRQRMSAARSYTRPLEIGEIITSDVVAEVIESRHPGFAIGDAVIGRLGWQSHAICDGANVQKVDRNLVPLPLWLGLLGSPGLTAYLSLIEFGRPVPGDTVVVSSAAGAVGLFAGQIARLAGTRVVGIVGSPEKQKMIEEVGYSSSVSYRSERFVSELSQACERQVNVFVDLVGGSIGDAVLSHLTPRARVVMCGRLATNNSATPDVDLVNVRNIWVQEAEVRAFSLYSHKHRFDELRPRLAQWYHEGAIRVMDTLLRGIEQVPNAFADFLEGRFVGRVIVEV